MKRAKPLSNAKGTNVRFGFFIFSFFIMAKATAQQITLKDIRSSYAGRPYEPIYLSDNPYSREKELLGKMLFFDPRLSGPNSMACASCHNPSLSWSDALPKAVGFGQKTLERKTPGLFNLAWASTMMWDGRLFMLEGQVLTPITNKEEMNQDLGKLVEEIKAIEGYRPYFEKAFPGQEVSVDLIVKAIAVFERGLVSGKAPFDEWIEGNDQAMSEDAKKGALLFHGKANCFACHSGWRFTDNGFHDIGIKATGADRKKKLPTKEGERSPFAMKTPGLRNLMRRAPYFHDGSAKTMMDVMDLYDRGGDVKRAGLAKEIFPLNLSADEKKQLVEFMKALQAWEKPVEVPILPP